ncbi:MerR family transcriptional regulator [Gordonia caeni]|uniref:MerR family transcriptional regulator n=1 Tax=Gordonia caeni TaxID=1007097 RepID=A0ABP7PND3_9ACTN
MTDELPIGDFARRSGLTASALRFYADSSVLLPARVDPVSGYRYYRADQIPAAVLLRRLREADVSLASATAALTATPAELRRLLLDHARRITTEAERKAAIAGEILASLGEGTPPVAGGGSTTHIELTGAVFAAAVDQVLTATGDDPAHPILSGVHLEVEDGSLTLAATDRYRLAVRTIPAEIPPNTHLTAVLDARDLATALSEIRRRPRVQLVIDSEEAVYVRMSDRADHPVRVLREAYPDHRSMIAGLDDPAIRLRLPRQRVLEILQQLGDPVRLTAAAGTVVIAAPDAEADTDATEVTGAEVSGTEMSGTGVTVWFALATLYPAIATAVGDTLLLDLRGPGLPATVRSADDGDLTTLVMPIAPTTAPAPPESGR